MYNGQIVLQYLVPTDVFHWREVRILKLDVQLWGPMGLSLASPQLLLDGAAKEEPA